MTAVPKKNPGPEDVSQKKVICVLSQEQYDEYEEEFSEIKQLGAEMIIIESTDMALAMISEINPDLVFVGMELEEMEGFEFLAMFTSQNPTFENPVVMLPEKADGLPPVVHCRSKDTGHSAVNGVDFKYIASLVFSQEPAGPEEPSKAHLHAVSDRDSSQEYATEASVEPESTEKEALTEKAALTQEQGQDVSSEVMGAPDPFLQDVEYRAQKKRKRSNKFLVYGLGGCLLLVVSIVYFSLPKSSAENPTSKGTRSPQNPVSDSQKASSGKNTSVSGTAASGTTVGEDEKLLKESTESSRAPTDEKEISGDRSVPSPMDHQSEIHLQLPSELVMPFEFDEGSHYAKVIDEERLNRIVEELLNKENQTVVLTGHASVRGKNIVNYKLGLQRAREAKKILAQKGIPEERIRVSSLGSNVPLSSDNDEENQEQNRRVTLTIQQVSQRKE